MRFGERLREARKKKGLTQAELAKKAQLGLRTIINYEGGSTYPRNPKHYDALAEALECDVGYLRGNEEEFVLMAQEEFGYRGKKGAEKLLEEVTALFAGGEMVEEDMDEMMLAIQEAYVIAKRNNRKYTPKKYRKSNEDKAE